MKKSLGRALSWVLCLSLLWGVVAPTGALAVRNDETPETPVLDEVQSVQKMEAPIQEEPAAADEKYEIYPTPQSVTYNEGKVGLPAEMKVTYGEGIDVYTKNRAVEAFGEAGVILSESADTAVQLRVSIKGDEAVTTATADLFDKYDAYKLVIDDTGVTVIGKDTDAAFYGLTTVKRILQQVTERQVRHLTVEDYADVALRGFIEGYYGNPWTVEDRAALMKFGGEYKMNIYFYAPKDDPKHSSKWRELYSAEELETKIRPLAEAGNKSKCYYGFALHPFWADGINYADETQYQADLAVLKAKFEQVMSVGVRQIAVLADDRGLPTVNSSYTEAQNTRASYIKLMKDVSDWVASEEMQNKYPGLKLSVPFCPSAYTNNGSSAQIKTLASELPSSVPIVLTGGTIWGEVSHSFLNAYKTNTGGRTFMWVNWPCSDNSKTSITMGAHDVVLHNDLTQEDIDTLQGIMLNPMQQSEPSKAGIFYNADYAWNIWNGDDHQERKDKVWYDSFKYVDHDSAIETEESTALRELAKHMIRQNGNGNNSYDESIELAPALTAFRNKLGAGTLTANDIAAMRAEFVKLNDAATLYKNKTTGNTRILGQRDQDGSYPYQGEQMAPWLDCWVEFTQAALDLLEALAASLDNTDGSKDNIIVNKYLSGQSNLTASQGHKFFYVSQYETAKVGGQHLIPFVNELLGTVSEKAKNIIDPNAPLTERIITNRGDTPEGGLAAMRDGDMSTEAVFKSGSKIDVGDYVGVQYNRPITLKQVRFEVGRAENPQDNFNGAKLQYLDEDGVWQDIPGGTFTSRVNTMEVTNLNLSAKGVRAIATAAVTGKWFGVKEIYINGKSGGDSGEATESGGKLAGTVIKTSGWSVWSGPESNLTDDDDSSYVWYQTPDNKSIVGDYIGLDLGKVKAVGRVRFVVGGKDSDKWTNYKLQYSADGTTWTDGPSYSSSGNKDIVDEDMGGVNARYIRLVNTAEIGKWTAFSEISVWGPSAASGINYRSQVVKRITNPKTTLTDESGSLKADVVILQPGQFVGIALSDIRAITDITADYTEAPGVVLEVGVNEEEMEVVDLASLASYSGEGRYIRLRNAGDAMASFALTELSVVLAPLGGGGITYVRANGLAPETANEDPLAWFDGDVSTRAKFATTQVVGRWVLYDLGSTREISSLRATIVNTDNDYPRNGVWELAESQDGPWTTVLTITTTLGTGQEDYNNPPSSNGSTEWQHDTANYFYQENTLDTPVSGRYLRYRVTSASSNYLRFNEITINGGEYVSAFENPSYTADPTEVSADFTPDKMRDGDLTTGFRPNMAGRTEGSVSYRVTDATSISQINLVEGTSSGAKVSVRPVGSESFIEIGTTSGGLGQFPVDDSIAGVAEIKLSWGDVIPTFYELITIPREADQESGQQVPSDSETVAINNYSGSDTSILFTENWKFNLGEASGADAKVFNDSAWRTVDLPHDYSVEQDFTGAGEAESGWLLGGVGWYRKSFTVDPSWANKVVTLDFDGVYMDSYIYLNGTKLGEHHYGYTPFSFVLPSDVLNYTGENVIAVKTDNPVPTSRWYSGSGIFRDVYLTVSEQVHVAKNGVTITTPDLEAEYKAGGAVSVHVAAAVENSSGDDASVTVKNTVYRGETAVANETVAAQNVSAGGTVNFVGTVNVSNPALWSVDTPNLYRMHTEVIVNGETVDTYDSEFGLRWFTINVSTGFALNGEAMKLKGVCMHHDQGALGSEAWRRAMERQVEILKDMGCNAIRATHNPYAAEFINICSRKGILVIEEIFDGWHVLKNGNSNDFARWFDQTISADNALVGKKANETWAQFVLESTIARDKNAPSVIAWSLGNEIKEGAGGADSGYTSRAASLITWGRAADATRPLTFGDNKLKEDWAHAIDISDQLAALENVATGATGGTRGGWVGMNYVTDGQLDSKHENYPTWPIYASETASHINSRGVYNVTGSSALNSDKLLTSYDKSAVSWGKVASDAWYTTIVNDYCAGEFVWTGFDYIGEPTPANQTVIGTGWNDTAPKNSYFGIVDTAGLPKDNYYLYRSMWNEKDTTLHVLPTWDQSDLLLTGGKAEVVVYSNAPVIRVYLNGVEVGAAKTNEVATTAGFIYRTFSSVSLKNGGTNTFQAANGHQSLYATFKIPYEAGTLEVKAFANASTDTAMTETVGRSVVRTTTGASKLVATADRDAIKNDGRDLSYITIDVVDANGEIVNGATPEITVSVTGDGVLMGLDNGVQPDHTSYLSTTRKAGAGRLVAIVQSTKTEGSFTVTARSAGLTSSSVQVSTGGVVSEVDGNTPVSYELSKLYYVQLNTEPELPTKVLVTMGDGSQVEKDVTWGNYNAAQLGTVGSEFAITGTIEGCSVPVPVSVGVVVVDNVVALLNYSTAIKLGGTPDLPDSRPAIMADGTVLSAQFPVTWDTLGADYSKVGTVKLTGRGVVFGEELTVTAWVRVDKETVIEGADVMNAALAVEPTTKGDLDDLRDGNAATKVTVDANGAISTRFDTAQNFYKVEVAYVGAAASGVTISISPDGINWTNVPAKQTASGNTVTYDLGEIRSAERLKLTFANGAEIAEMKFINATSDFAINSTAELDDIKLSGVSASPSALANRVVSSSAVLGTILPVSGQNVAYTMLPEDAEGQTIIVTESEDHANRDMYTVILGATDAGAEDDSKDYPYNKTTATAGSDNGGTVGSAVDGNEGSIWHSAYNNGSEEANASDKLVGFPEKRWFQLELQEATDLAALRYKPRPSGNINGTVKDYRIEVSVDGTSWTEVATGTWDNSADWKTADFDRTVTAKYVKLWGTNTYGEGSNANQFMSAAEVRVVVGAGDTDISPAVVTVSPEVMDWTGEALEPTSVTVTLFGQTLTQGTDYTLSYEQNVDAGTAYVYANGKGEYFGAATGSFRIREMPVRVTGFEPVQVNVLAGGTPVLPQTVTAIMSAGEPKEMAVTWDAIPGGASGTYTLQGSVEGTDKKATAVVTVVAPVSVDGVSTVTPVGRQPTLPATVTVRFDNSTAETYPVTWSAVDVSTPGTVTVNGAIAGLSITATASVRVEEATTPTGNLALNTNYASQIFPFAMSNVSAGNNNPYQAIKGTITGSTASTDRWSDWERNTPHTTSTNGGLPWLGVAFETSTQNVAVGEGQVLTLVPHLVNQVKVMFVDENGGTDSAVTFPTSYKIQYYTGPVENLTFDTRVSNVDEDWGNGRVRGWTGSPLNNDNNWSDVAGASASPSTIPTTNGSMIEVSFTEVETAIIRVVCTPKSGKWAGIQALEVHGLKTTSYADFTPTISIGGTNVTSQFTGTGNALSMDRELTDGTVPTVTATATNNARVSIKQAANGSDTAVVTITSEDGSTTKTYTIQFSQQNATFAVTADGTGFTVTPNSGIAAGASVTVTPNTGKEFTSLIVYTATGSVETTAGANGSRTFTMPAANVTVKAAVTSASYLIAYDLNGGVVTGGTNPSEYNGDGTITLVNPVRTDYTFAGWTGTGLTGATMNVTIPAGAAGDRQYTATWTANVAHAITLPAGLSANLTSAKVGRTITLTSAKGYEATGITVTGPGGAIAVASDGSFTMPNGAVSVTATASPISYTITYDLDGGTVAQDNKASYTVESANFTLKNPTKEGYLFVGWTGTGVATPTKLVTVTKGSTGNRSYTANWREEIHSDFEVTYIKIDGVDRKSAFNANKTLNMTIAANASIPVVTAAATKNATVTVQQATAAPGTATVTIVSEDGSLTEVYTIRLSRAAPEVYSVNLPTGGKVTASPASGIAGTEITLSVPTGYEIASVTVTANGQEVSVADNKFTMPEGDATVSATVTAIRYTITYYLNGGEVAVANKTSYTVEDASFILNNPTKEGYVFSGWTGTDITGAKTSVTITKGSTGDRTYTAAWQAAGSSSGSGTGTGTGAGPALPPDTVVDEGGNKITTTENANGETVVTTVQPDGATTTVTTAPTGEQTATIVISQDVVGAVEAVMPALVPGESAETAPTVTISSTHSYPTRLTIPVEGEGSTVAVRVAEDGTQTIVPMSVVDEEGLHLLVEDGDTYKIIDNKKVFDDISDTFWGVAAVDFVASRELFQGVAKRTFAPAQTMNRAMMVTVLWRMSEKPESSVENTFHDVSDKDYYADAVRWGVENNVIQGTNLGFEPQGTVTREMLATMLYRAAGSPGVVDELPRRFTDTEQVSGWAETAMIWAVQNGIIQGRAGNTLAPRASANRAEAAAMLQRYINLMV